MIDKLLYLVIAITLGLVWRFLYRFPDELARIAQALEILTAIIHQRKD